MDENDILHIIIRDELGTTPTFLLQTEYIDGTNNENEVPGAPITSAASDITSSSFMAHWSFTENATGYYLDVATDSAFTSMVAGYDGLDVGNVIEYNVTGLVSNFPYYYRTRGYNDNGEGVNSDAIAIITLMETTVDGDGNTYTYITIGAQQWLVENLKTTKYIDGTAIPNITVNATWTAEDGSAGHDGGYCWYNNDVLNKPIYGALYNWYASTNAHGIAPVGWRVATKADYQALDTFLGGSAIGGILKEIGITHWNTPNTGAINTYGFTSLGGGVRAVDGSFQQFNNLGIRWTTTAINATTGSGWGEVYNSSEIAEYQYSKKYGFAIRCVRDI